MVPVVRRKPNTVDPASAKSLMPDGFESRLTRQEMAELLRKASERLAKMAESLQKQ